METVVNLKVEGPSI